MKCPYQVWRQYLVPQHLFSQAAGILARCKIRWFKSWAIRRFIRLYPIHLSLALEPNPDAYPSFQDFFIRQLNPIHRPIDSHPDSICSPCDGTISQIGKIKHDTLVQAKGRTFTLGALLGNENLTQHFVDGHYATIYLAPQDYHRIHMPLTGTLQSLHYLPGKLFSVNPITAQHIDKLFARNERAVTLFKHSHGTFAVILVGAMVVGNIVIQWQGSLTTRPGQKRLDIYYESHQPPMTLNKGDEMGYFSLGSTVILLLDKNAQWGDNVDQHSRIVVGQRIGQILS